VQPGLPIISGKLKSLIDPNGGGLFFYAAHYFFYVFSVIFGISGYI
jgi:hypothetical protein